MKKQKLTLSSLTNTAELTLDQFSSLCYQIEPTPSNFVWSTLKTEITKLMKGRFPDNEIQARAADYANGVLMAFFETSHYDFAIYKTNLIGKFFKPEERIEKLTVGELKKAVKRMWNEDVTEAKQYLADHPELKKGSDMEGHWGEFNLSNIAFSIAQYILLGQDIDYFTE